MKSKVLYLAIADARGHLMKSILVKELLAQDDIDVDIITTSEEGQEFVRSFGYSCDLLKDCYLNQYDAVQNLDINATRAAVMDYMLSPWRFPRHVTELVHRLGDYAVAFNDTFNAAMLAASFFRKNIINVYVKNIMRSVIHEMDGHPLIKGSFHFAMSRAFANIEIGIRPLEEPIFSGRKVLLNPLLMKPELTTDRKDNLAVIYLNPLFRDPRLGQALMQFLKQQGYNVHAVGEGMMGMEGWLKHDPKLGDKIAHADLVVSAPGMGVLSQVIPYKRRFIGLYTAQPEQQRNIRQVQHSGNVRVVDLTMGPETWARQLEIAHTSLLELPQEAIDHEQIVKKRQQQWRAILVSTIRAAQEK